MIKSATKTNLLLYIGLHNSMSSLVDIVNASVATILVKV